ncbi:PLP-dependent aminotransferase family protein [Aliiroseovarius sp.]|uniref:MocR-like pyridoxine biosynthesis transcription factor PdxR n=1 Tax=Aliiroseovarius sp. TaxID=1872442 RepID=UPI003BABDBD2
MDVLAGLGFEIDRDQSMPVFEQVCSGIRERIVSGRLSAGTRLPPTRGFATEVGVSRSTIVTAYEQLVAEGYLTSRQGSGYTVCDLGGVELPTSRPTPAAKPGRPPRSLPVRAFQAGRPDMRLFPHRQWAKTVARICRTAPERMLTGATVAGNPDLCRAIADHVAEWRGIEAEPAQVLITAGASDGLELCLRTLTRPGDSVGLESPGYPPLEHLLQVHGARMTEMPVDEEGAGVPASDKECRLAILTPSHQFPLGGAMSANRRMEFIRWAHAQDGWVIEDDYDSEFRYAGRPIPAMAGVDRLDRTIYVGSFSKIFSNALRLGYLIVPRPLVEPFREVMGMSGIKASLMPQQALAEFMQGGDFFRHLRRVRRIYADRRRFLLSHLSGRLAPFGWFEDHHAGMQVVFHLSCGLSDREVEARCAARGVAVQPLSAYARAGAESDLNGLVLGFCAHDEEEMAPALEVLAEVLETNPGNDLA